MLSVRRRSLCFGMALCVCGGGGGRRKTGCCRSIRGRVILFVVFCGRRLRRDVWHANEDRHKHTHRFYGRVPRTRHVTPPLCETMVIVQTLTSTSPMISLLSYNSSPCNLRRVWHMSFFCLVCRDYSSWIITCFSGGSRTIFVSTPLYIRLFGT